MPLLGQEPYLNPEGLFSLEPILGEGEWFVLHSRPRVEKTLARALIRRALPFFLPLYTRRWRHNGRLLTSHLPLFPGYVFFYGDSEARRQALESNLVVQVLKVPDQNQLTADLTRILDLVRSGLSLAPEDRLQPGATVEILKGPLAGLHGTVLRSGNRQLRLLVEVRFLNQGVSVDIESWMLRAVLHPQTDPMGRFKDERNRSKAVRCV